MQQLRQIKSDAEIVLMQQAIDITDKAFHRVLKFVKPGVMEYEIEAEIQHEFLRNRASGPAYGSIIASGPNACVLHYVDNNLACQDGDVVLMDFGAEYANYAADLTRCIPVGGIFTKRQREVYNAVLSVLEFATGRLVVGNRIDDYHKEVGLAMEEQLIKLGLLDVAEVKQQDPERPLYKRYFMHGTSHFLGLDVHDVGNKFEPMKAGMVFTCEPGIYIPEEGLGIRLENDILITDKGNVNLMQRIPLEVSDIEAVMAS
jgi:Xaa-Pro aminopeptidase